MPSLARELSLLLIAVSLSTLGCGSGRDAPARPPDAGGLPAGDGGSVPGSDPSPPAVPGGEALVRAPRSDGDVVLIEVGEVQEKLARGAPLVVIDARNAEDFEREHIPGSINVPLQKIATAGELPGLARDYEIVVYCVAEACPISKNAARALARLGYTNVKDMRAGLVGWKQAGFETMAGGG